MTDTVVELDGQRLRVSNLEKVLYPDTAFTKAEVIDYYVRIAPAMLPHIAERGITLRRYPNGVDGQSFFEKRCASHRPEFVGTFVGPGDRVGGIDYCRLDSIAALAWAANMAGIEIHAPMAEGHDIESPQLCVFDLDPGEPATIVECARIGLAIRDVLAGVGLECIAKTSGSKGMQLYVPLNTPHTHDHASAFAHAVAQVLEKHRPEEVTSVMAKKLRPGKIFIDWSQNSRHKTTIAPYSLRARPRPTVSTPVTWDEVSDTADLSEDRSRSAAATSSGGGAAPLSFVAREVLERVERLGDLFAPAATLEQQLPPA